MNKTTRLMVLIIMSVLVLNSFITFASDTDSEGWRKTIEIEELIYDTAAIISVNITKNAEESYAIQYMTTNIKNEIKTIASLRLSAAGKILFRNNAGWIGREDENAEALIRADFVANETYNLKMKFTLRSGLVEWYLNDALIGTSVSARTGNPCDHIRLMATKANKDKIEWEIESVIDENRETTVLEKTSPVYKGSQGEDGWYFCEYGIEEVSELTLNSDGTRWVGENGSSPIINRRNYDIVPRNDIDVGFTCVVPKTGMVRLMGNATMPYADSVHNGGVILSISKGRKEIWSEELVYGTDVSYYYTIPVEAGEKLHFKVNSNGNNSCDWTHWTPTVEYLDIEYIPEDEIYTFFQKKDGAVTELAYSEAAEGYLADDGYAFISHTAVRPGDEYAVGKSYTAEKDGRYRVFGKFGVTDEPMLVSVFRGSEKVWEQLLPAGESGVLDVRMQAQEGDVIAVEISAYGNSPSLCPVEDLYIESSYGMQFCRASTSKGHSFNILEEYSFGELLEISENTKVYSQRFSRKLPMIYDSESEKWVSGIEGDPGYIGKAAAYPGRHYESVAEIIVPKSGIIRIDGNMSVKDISDGVISKILLNDEVIWSSRVGGERVVRWDEPYDTSYFSNEVGAAARVTEGDRLAFSFNQWRLTDNDKVELDDIKLQYIDGDVLSETTRWKLSKSIVVDTKLCIAEVNGLAESVDVIVKNDTVYLAASDFPGLFGTDFSTSETPVSINGTEYLPLRSVAEEAGKTVVWAADRLVIIYDGIPVLFGWNELSEISVEYSDSVPREVYGCFDTYEEGTTAAISTEGSLADGAENAGGLKPSYGYAEITEQSNAVVLEYSGNENLSSNTSNIKIKDYVENKKKNLIGFDIFIPSPCSFGFSLSDDESKANMQFFVSAMGWIGPCYGVDLNSSEANLWINRDSAEVIDDLNFAGAEFEFGKWNNIKFIYDTVNKQYHLYLNDTRVHTVKEENLINSSLNWNVTGVESIQITNYSAKDGVKTPLYIDNVTVGTMDSFIAKKELTDSSLASLNITLSDTFEEEDSQDILTAWNGESQLRPMGGFARNVKQSNSARIMSGRSGANTEHIRFDISEYLGNRDLPAVISFDVNLFGDTIVVFSERSYLEYGQQAMVSPKGYIAAAYGIQVEDEAQSDYIRELASKDAAALEAEGVDTQAFEKNKWHNIKMIFEDGGTKRLLYVDDKPVTLWSDTGKAFPEAFQITILTDENNNSGNALFDIDNLKIAQLNRFIITDFYSEDNTGREIESFVPGEECYIHLAAENNNSYAESIQLYIAQYDSDGNLINITVPTAISVEENGGKLNIGYGFEDNRVSFKAYENAERIIIYAWDGNEMMKPLTEAECICKQDITQ